LGKRYALRYALDELRKVPKPLKANPTAEQRMTKREADVARWTVEGLSNREIGGKLSLTEQTVKNYLFNVFKKLGVSNRVELALLLGRDGGRFDCGRLESSCRI
jgi:two-component system nitrate/nitrite response regulator NarL